MFLSFLRGYTNSNLRTHCLDHITSICICDTIIHNPDEQMTQVSTPALTKTIPDSTNRALYQLANK